MIKAFLFDFDGTLVDTMEGFADIAGRIIQENHPEDYTFDDARRRYIETSGVPFCQQMEIIYPGHPDNEKIVKEFEETKVEGFFEQKFEEDVKGAIAGLKEKGYLVGVSSGNFPDLINELVKREKIDFDIVMGFDEANKFEKGKPHFDHFRDLHKLEKEELVFVGDSLKDADKAYEYGIKFIGKTGLFSSEEFDQRYSGVKTIDNLKELLDL